MGSNLKKISRANIFGNAYPVASVEFDGLKELGVLFDRPETLFIVVAFFGRGVLSSEFSKIISDELSAIMRSS